MKSEIKKIFSAFGFQINRLPENSTLSKNEIFDIIDTIVDDKHYEFLRRGKSFLRNLKDVNATFEFSNDKLIITIEELKFYINSWEELLILNEVFVEGIYNYKSEEEFILFDIGMNVGITSLYFSKNKKCLSIFAYEPFSKTLEFAKLNFSLNDTSSKIKVFNYGLGFPTRTIKVNYNEEFKGSVGINGVAEYINVDQEKVLELEIRDVADNILKNVLNNNKKIILKIDCEGAEYEIINRLKEQNILSQISGLMIEWHVKGPTQILEILIGENFKIFSFNESSKTIGMIYATK
jgi:FkbM family methyltransferase